MKPYALSYQIDTVHWDGKFVQRLEPETYMPMAREIKDAGVNELMISGYVTVEEAAFDMEEETKALGARLDAIGMRPAQHHGLSALYAPLANDQTPVIERLIRSVRLTANMNAPALVLHPCQYYEPESWKKEVPVDVMFYKEAEKYGEEAVLKTAAMNLREAGKEAEKLGVKIAMENLDHFYPMCNRFTLTKIIEMAGHPNIGYCLDSGHAHCCGQTSVVEWIHIMGNKLFTTHFHDNRGLRNAPKEGWISPNGIDEHMTPGFGTIPWIDVIQALREIGYDRTVNFETKGWPCENGFRYAVQYWRMMELMAEQKLPKKG